jgi:succinyl-CoA synthetase beta subunit
MKIHEYQAKEIFRRFRVPVPKGGVAATPQEARKVARELGAAKFAVKAQIHAGGRGKGTMKEDPSIHGIALVASVEEVEEAAGKILGKTLVTKQTGEAGRLVQKVLVEEASEIEREFYIGMAIDRATESPTMIASAEGGMSIEELAAEKPQAIIRMGVDPVSGLHPFQARALALQLGFTGKAINRAAGIFTALAKLFLNTDASLAEINPLVVTGDGAILALDAKINFDDNALFRHKDYAQLRDLAEEDPLEAKAKEVGISYVSLEGNIGCMVNGAGLAMATNDILTVYGGQPANFLDVGGGASAEQVEEAFKIILGDTSVKAIWVNIYGGIARCDIIAEGIITAAKKVGLPVGLVVRLQGTNAQEGRKMLAESGLELATATTMADGAEKVIEAAGGTQLEHSD